MDRYFLRVKDHTNLYVSNQMKTGGTFTLKPPSEWPYATIYDMNIADWYVYTQLTDISNRMFMFLFDMHI